MTIDTLRTAFLQSGLSAQELIGAMAELFNETPPFDTEPPTDEEIDAILREAGYDPVVVGLQFSAMVKRIIEESNTSEALKKAAERLQQRVYYRTSKFVPKVDEYGLPILYAIQLPYRQVAVLHPDNLPAFETEARRRGMLPTDYSGQYDDDLRREVEEIMEKRRSGSKERPHVV